MDSLSLSTGVKRLDSEVRLILRKVDLGLLSSRQRQQVSELQQFLSDARLYIGEFEASETKEERTANAKQAKKLLRGAMKRILSMSEQNIFSPVDVAQIGAETERIIDNLKKEKYGDRHNQPS